MKRKVFLDLHHLRNTKKGFGQYSLNLAKGIIDHNFDDLNLNYYVPLNWNYRFGRKVTYKTYFGFHRKSNNFKDYDVWHNLTHLSKIEPKKSDNTKFIYTIHDAIFTIINISEERKQKEIKHLQSKIDKSSSLVYISEFTKNCIHQNFTIHDNIKEYVIYNGNPFENVKPIISKKHDFPYLLCVGEYRKYKNHSSLIPMLTFIDKDIKLIFIGKYSKEKQDTILKIAMKYNVENRLLFFSNVSEQIKIELYSNALALVHPSLAEGFGLPVIEAMSLGIPVIISNNTALPEVGGEVAHYWNHYDAEYMANILNKAIDDFYNNRELRTSQLIKQANKFSWSNAAQQYIDVYRTI